METGFGVAFAGPNPGLKGEPRGSHKHRVRLRRD